MADIVAIKDYIKKLQKIINFDAEFKLFGYNLVKKRKIDDMLCCIIASLPDSYKKMLRNKGNIQEYSSMLSYATLTKFLAKKFFLDSNLCMVNVSQVNKFLSNILVTIERDIRDIENRFNN